jgi:hypothetical protein
VLSGVHIPPLAGFSTSSSPIKGEETVIDANFSIHDESFGASPSFDIPPSAGDEVQDKSIHDESITYIKISNLKLHSSN